MQNTTRVSNADIQCEDYLDEKDYIAQQLIAIEEIRTRGEIPDITIKVRIWRLFERIAWFLDQWWWGESSSFGSRYTFTQNPWTNEDEQPRAGRIHMELDNDATRVSNSIVFFY